MQYITPTAAGVNAARKERKINSIIEIIVVISRTIHEAVEGCLDNIINVFNPIANKAISTQKLYKKDADFKRYVDRYCQSRGFTVKEALRHDLVKEVGKYYAEEMIDEKVTEIFRREY